MSNLPQKITFNVQTKVLPTKGNMVYEYNPFRNYRLTQNKYEYKDQLYTLDELSEKFQITPNEDHTEWRQQISSALSVPLGSSEITLHEKGELVDFITNELSFDIEHPVNIIPQYSYDGSVNLILNDGINPPRLINSRFSTTGMNTYEIIDRKGNNDTNIYDEGDQFDIDTSLYKRVTSIPKLIFQGVSAGGNLKIGNYHFYFKLSDADGNETDFVAESGLVSVFIGFNDPSSVTSGVKNENSFKSVSFQLYNIDTSYSIVTVYYSRYTAEQDENFNTEYIKLDKKYIVNNAGYCNILVTGFENTIPITAADINDSYEIVDSVKAQTQCQNMLFLGNIHKPEIPYEELSDLSLRFLPFLKEETYELQIDQDYHITSNNLGYYDPSMIYNKTGYWNQEIYRLGIVYILNDGQLTPVFNIRGALDIGTYSSDSYSNFPVYEEKNGQKVRKKITYNEETYLINSAIPLENVKGVIRFKATKDNDTIYGIDIRVDNDTIQELKKYIKGYFFVRQSRIPTILAQGITIGIDQVSHTPTIPTKGGIINDINNIDHTYIETSDINGVNFISEGFLQRFSYHLKAKNSFLKVFSTILSSVAFVASFVPGIGSLTSLAINATDFVISSIATGSLQTAAFVATLASSLPVVGTAATKIATKLAADAEKVAKLTNTANKLTKVATTISKVNKVVTPVATITANTVKGVDAVSKTIDTIETITSQDKSTSYNGRNTKVPKGYKKVEDSDSRKLNDDFSSRVIIKDSSKNSIQAILCPDYEVNPAYFNQIFTGNKHLLRTTKSQGVSTIDSSNYFSNEYRHFYHPAYYDSNITNSYNVKIISVPEDVKCVGLDNDKFRSRAGYAEESWRYEQVGYEYTDDSDKQTNTDVVRGVFGSYLGISKSNIPAATTVNIMIPQYSESNIAEYFTIRMDDSSTYSAISDRIDISELEDYDADPKDTLAQYTPEQYKFEVYRGDCYICQFTHRVIRNFNDPSAPYNDEIVDENTWKDHYNPSKTEDYENINLGDVNAVQLGMWVTFRVRSSYNLNIRTLDSSNIDEKQMTGHPRGYYPYVPMNVEGTYKIPESHIYNRGFSKSLSDRWNNILPDVPYIKNWFGTRIMYSDIHINDAYKNGFRVFRKTRSVDYTREYGEIVKLISLNSNLLIIFEHGVAIAPVNQQAVQQSVGQFIATSRVLPEAPTVISDMFGSQWADSVLKVPGLTGDSKQYVYGVDTVTKKIWRTDGQTLQCISDFKVQEFLNNNITLSERELTPKLGIRNVKTCYNAYKRDVLFTFYDNTYGYQEKVWNLCYNELLDKFITFYSWVPSFMENIDNIPFSFNRETSKWISKLGVSHASNSFSDGITLTNVIFDSEKEGNTEVSYDAPITYITKTGEVKTITCTVASRDNFVGILGLANRVLPDYNMPYTINYELCRDIYGNYKNFKIQKMVYQVTGNPYIQIGTDGNTSDAMFNYKVYVYGLYMNNDSPLYVRNTNSSTETDKVLVTRNGNDGREAVYLHRNMDNKLLSELYYRNNAGNSYSDDESHRITPTNASQSNLPIFKNLQGKREMLPREQQINADTIVKLLNIKATIEVTLPNQEQGLQDYYYNKQASYQFATYESTVAIIPQRNMQFLTTDFWKHGQAGIFDIADDIYPCYWYGKQHPFEFEVIVVNDPSVHKIFTNLELVANKAKPESFHYEVIGEAYDFAKDKPNMYFRQEAMKALWQYNGCDIEYNNDFLKIQTRQQAKSADLPHNYYARRNGLNEVEDYYIASQVGTHDYRHLSGGEIVYYPNRQEFRVWNHALAVDVDDQPDTIDSAYGGRGLMASNMRYLEDRWKVQINPLLITYKNEYVRKDPNKALCIPENSTWKDGVEEGVKLPPLPLYNSPIPDEVKTRGEISIPGYSLSSGNSTGYTTSSEGKDNAMYNLYKVDFENNIHPFDTDSWLDDVNIYKYNFGSAQNRKETDMRDKFIKIRIRYSGEELAVIDFLNTIYQISYA